MFTGGKPTVRGPQAAEEPSGHGRDVQGADSVSGKRSLRPNQPGKWLARVSAHARDAGMCNSCGPRAETCGQGWQLEMKDRWGRAHLTECYMQAGVRG